MRNLECKFMGDGSLEIVDVKTLVEWEGNRHEVSLIKVLTYDRQ